MQPSSGVVGISVVDTGLGISKKALPYVFDRFYKADREDANDNDSMGLGLAITKRILELHEAEIRVVSEEQRGTQFHFNLPLRAHAA